MKRWAWGVGVVLALAVALALLWPRVSPPGREEGGAAPSSRAGVSGRGSASAPGEAGAPAAPGSSARGSLRGVVLSLIGQPVAGVPILVLPVPEGGASWSGLPCQRPRKSVAFFPDTHCMLNDSLVEELLVVEQGREPALLRTTSDARGTFELTGLQDGLYEVWAEAPHAVAAQQVAAGAGEVRLLLEEGLRVHGVVWGEADEPIAGATVLALPHGLVRRLETVSGADGRYSLGRLPRRAYWVVASHAGLLPAAELLAEPEEREVHLGLLSPHVLVGRVVRGGQGVAGVTVRATGFRYEQSARTDGQGQFTFEGVRRGAYTLEATDGRESAVVTAAVEPDVEQQPPVLELRPCGVLEGRVTVGAAPLPEAGVTFRHSGEEDYERSTRTDAQGHYRFDCLVAGEFEVSVAARGFQSRSAAGETPLQEGETRRLDWTLPEAAPFEGLVVDDAGRPVPGARLAVSWVEDVERPMTREHVDSAEALTGEDGRFSVDGLAPGTYTVEISASEDFQPWSDAVQVPLTGGRFELRRARPAPGVIVGTVVDEQGQPVAEAIVEVLQGAAQEPAEPVEPVRTDGLGQFRFQKLPLGAWRVFATHEGMDHDAQVRAVADVELHGPEPVRVHLRLDAGLPLSGLVVDGQGAPVPSALVSAFRLNPGSDSPLLGGTAETDEEGHFALRHLAPGDYRVDVRPGGEQPSLRPTVRSARAGDTGVRIVLEVMRQVRGRVVHADGSPVSTFFANGLAFTETDGRFSLPIEASGQLAIVFAAEGLAPTLRQVQVSADTDAQLPDVVLTRGWPVRGQVVAADTGEPLPEAWVAPFDLVGASGLFVDEDSGRAWTREDGRFLMPAVEPGSTLTVYHDRYQPARVPVPRGEQELLIRLLPYLIREPEP